MIQLKIGDVITLKGIQDEIEFYYSTMDDMRSTYPTTLCMDKFGLSTSLNGVLV